jgi:hypothetical protein
MISLQLLCLLVFLFHLLRSLTPIKGNDDGEREYQEQADANQNRSPKRGLQDDVGHDQKAKAYSEQHNKDKEVAH